MNHLQLTAQEKKAVFAHAERTYPKECCGVGVGFKNQTHLTALFECANAADQFHHNDPENFPRTERDAYVLDPDELLKIHRRIREQGEDVRLIYHSHPDSSADFSAEDARLALYEGEPIYKHAVYLVIALNKGRVTDCKWWDWHPQLKKFQELPITTDEIKS